MKELSTLIEGRGLHSSTSQLDLSQFWSLMPQLPSTFELNLRRVMSMNCPKLPTKSAYVLRHAGKWTPVVHENCLR